GRRRRGEIARGSRCNPTNGIQICGGRGWPDRNGNRPMGDAGVLPAGNYSAIRLVDFLLRRAIWLDRQSTGIRPALGKSVKTRAGRCFPILLPGVVERWD